VAATEKRRSLKWTTVPSANGRQAKSQRKTSSRQTGRRTLPKALFCQIYILPDLYFAIFLFCHIFILPYFYFAIFLFCHIFIL